MVQNRIRIRLSDYLIANARLINTVPPAQLTRCSTLLSRFKLFYFLFHFPHEYKRCGKRQESHLDFQLS